MRLAGARDGSVEDGEAHRPPRGAPKQEFASCDFHDVCRSILRELLQDRGADLA